jgi:hypothetical protein
MSQPGFAGLAAAAASTADSAATRTVISFRTTATSCGRTGQPLPGCWLVAVRAPGSRQREHSSTTGTGQAAIRFNPASHRIPGGRAGRWRGLGLIRTGWAAAPANARIGAPYRRPRRPGSKVAGLLHPAVVAGARVRQPAGSRGVAGHRWPSWSSRPPGRRRGRRGGGAFLPRLQPPTARPPGGRTMLGQLDSAGKGRRPGGTVVKQITPGTCSPAARRSATMRPRGQHCWPPAGPGRLERA